MLNLYDAIKESSAFRKMQVNELLFVEYTCMREETKFGIWSDSNYFVFISSGKKMWKSVHHSYEVVEGDMLFVKKGANLTHQFFDDEFCAIFMFVPDDFIKSFLQRNTWLQQSPRKITATQDAVLRIAPDPLLQSYHQSIKSYLGLPQTPNEKLLLLKFEELLLSLFTGTRHQQLADYFISLCHDQAYQLSRIMEENFAYNLTVENYARLCHMSLSSFKKLFRQQYNSSPAAWLKQKKLQLAVEQVLGTQLPISHVAFNCGFEDNSHFIRVFKQYFQLTPLQYRQQYSSKAT
ncbi:MAG TPA: AraC family transcriptional regulator [Chitinophagaceae bacterium]|nr:AraC family transcriptional regulator [Chitinophagaceae bacterium]